MFLLALISVNHLICQELSGSNAPEESSRYRPLVVAQSEPGGESAPRKLWYASVAALTAASAVDAHSSWNKCCEANRLLASSNGRFGGRAVSIKAGALGANLLVQHWLAKKSPLASKVLSFVNFGGAALLTSVAVRNYGISQPAARQQLRQ